MRKAIQTGKVRLVVQKRLMLVLPVHVHDERGEGAQHGERDDLPGNARHAPSR